MIILDSLATDIKSLKVAADMKELEVQAELARVRYELKELSQLEAKYLKLEAKLMSMLCPKRGIVKKKQRSPIFHSRVEQSGSSSRS